MTIKLKLIVLLVLFSITSVIYSQSQSITMTLDEAVNYALSNSYASKNAKTDVEIAQKKVRETLAIGLPQISANGSITKNLLVPEIALEFGGETQVIKMGQTYNSSYGARLDQLIFDGSYLVGLQASKVYVQLSKDAKDKTDIEIKDAVSQLYFLCLVAQQNINDFSISLENNKKTLTQAEQYYKNGFIEDIDVDQIRLMTNESERMLFNAQKQYDISLAVLKYAMGFDIDGELALSNSMDNLISSIPESLKGNGDVNAHIDYRILQTQINIKGLDIKNQKAHAMPRFSGYANYDFSRFGDKFSNMYKTKSSAIGLSLSVPIFSSGMRGAQLAQKKLELNQLETNRIAMEQNLKKEFLVARTNLDNAKKMYENTKLSKDIASRVYNKSSIKFENGMISTMDLSDNQNKMIEAIISFHNASANYYNMYLAFLKANAQL